MTGILVHRVGNVLAGYLTRVAVVVLSTLACWRDKKAWISFMGCGVVWSLVELSIALSGNRVGAMALNGSNLAYAAAIIRGFSEGAAVAGCALVPTSIWTIMAAVLILFDAAVMYDGAVEVSMRLVSNPRSYVFVIGISMLWVAWNPKRGAYPAWGMWNMTVFGFLWNVVGISSGARIVRPTEASLPFAAYDGLFEIGLLYAGLSQIALVCFSHLLEPEEKHLQERRPSLAGPEGAAGPLLRTLSDEEGNRAAAAKLVLLADELDEKMDGGGVPGLDFSEAYRVHAAEEKACLQSVK